MRAADRCRAKGRKGPFGVSGLIKNFAPLACRVGALAALMDDSQADSGYDAASRTLRWDCMKSGNSADLLRLLREHASTLRQLHVA